MRAVCLFFLAWLAATMPRVASADSASLLAQAQRADPARYQYVLDVGAQIRATSDNRSFSVWWQPASAAPKAVIVSLHGHDAFATTDMALWQPYARQRGYAVLTLQWWFGAGESIDDYYKPQEMYPIIAALLAQKGVKPGSVLFAGYSRGAANTYSVAALDIYSGNRYFGTTLSISGGAISDYPPNQQIAAGAYGAKPFAGMRWIMYCGERDPNPTMDGCPAMTAARTWVTALGATITLFIDDPAGDHGGFMTNPANVNAALSAFVPLTALTVTEYFNVVLNHYFITASADEANAIDRGFAGPGWMRTGQSFGAWAADAAPPDAAPVCRFYGSTQTDPVTGARLGPESHFFTVNAAECAGLMSSPSWTYEGIAFAIAPATDGACPAGATPIRRVYNGRWRENDSNHRYLVGEAGYQAMIAAGWLAEGIVMCAVGGTAAAT